MSKITSLHIKVIQYSLWFNSAGRNLDYYTMGRRSSTRVFVEDKP